MTFVQRFGGALNLNVHFHTLALDGAYRHTGEDGTMRFQPVPPPTAEELERILDRVVRGVARLIERRGFGDEPDRLFEEDPLLAQLLTAAVQGRAASGPRTGQRVLRFGDRVEIEPGENGSAEAIQGLARSHGFSLHAGVAVPPNDRRRLERLCRYAGRPPVATERLSELGDGRLLYELRHRWKDGTTHVVFEPLELIDRLAALVPPPRFHTVRYHGVLASRSKHRAEIVPGETAPAVHSAAITPSLPCGHPPPRAATAGPRPAACANTETEADPRSPEPRDPRRPVEAPSPPQPAVEASTKRASRPSRYYSWSELMRRVFEIDVLRCPRCRATPMRILAAIHPPTVTRAILKSLGLPTRAPPIATARPVPVSPHGTLAEPVAVYHVTRPAA